MSVGRPAWIFFCCRPICGFFFCGFLNQSWISCEFPFFCGYQCRESIESTRAAPTNDGEAKTGTRYMGGATDFKVGGVQNRIRERSERKKILYPHFSKCGGYNLRTSKQISVGAYWIYWNLLSGCRINKNRQVRLWYYESGKETV